MIAECGNHCITVYDEEGKKVQSFETKEGKFNSPHGVVVTYSSN